MNAKPKAKAVERKKIRWLLFFYDSLAFLICAYITFMRQGDAVFYGIPHSMIVYLLVFSCRLFVFRVYNQVWRNNALRAYARLFASDMLGGAVAVVLIRYCMPDSLEVTNAFMRSLGLVMLNFAVSLFARFCYFYLYVYVTSGNKYSDKLRKLLEKLTLVDFDSKDGVMSVVLVPSYESAEPINAVQKIIRQFSIRGDLKEIRQITKGYINQTYLIETTSEYGHTHRYTLQRINTNVFKDPDALMDNITLVTRHLGGRLELPGCPTRESATLEIRCTKDGRSYYRDDSGCWRMMKYIDDAYSMNTAENKESFYYAGQAFGKFLVAVSDLDASDIKAVIPAFHNTYSYYLELEDAVARDSEDRVKECEYEIGFIRERSQFLSLITNALESGRIPRRICHNDTNLNNILFSKDKHLPVAIIDLDTVMATTPLFDFGDSMRIGTNKAEDDEKDLSKVSCDLELYEAYARGYLEACGSILTKSELELLPYAALVISSEDGIRFLMDHLRGDTYYNIFYPGQNLDRCRTQLALVKDMESKLPEIIAIHEKIYSELGLEADLRDELKAEVVL